MIHETKNLKMRDGVNIYMQVKEIGSPYWVISIHGVGEHLNRHQYISELLGQDFNILQFDLRGHGKSGGKRAYVDSFKDYYEDLFEILEFLRTEYKPMKYSIIGHSMGALIAAGFLEKFVRDDFYPSLVFLSSPPILVGGIAGKIVEFTPIKFLESLSKFPFSYELPDMVNINFLSHDARIHEQYLHDDLNCLKLHTKLILNLVLSSKEVFSKPIRPKCPAVCIVGSEDKVVNVNAIEEYFNQLEKGFHLKIFEGAFHEVHNEISKYREPYFEFIKETFKEVFYNR